MTTIRDIFPGASQPQTLTCGLTDILREEASLLRDADVDKLAASQTRWYTSEHQYEELTGHVYDFYPGDKYEDDDNYLAPVYLAVVTSNDTDIVYIDSELYPAQADALSRAETMAQWLAEHEYAFNYHRDHGAQARDLLCESHHVRREAVRLTRLAHTFAAQGMRSDADCLAHKELLADAARAFESAARLRKRLRAFIEEHHIDYGQAGAAWRDGWTSVH